MGFASLGVLESVVRATIGLRWEEVGELSNILALVDADISQAIQVSHQNPTYPSGIMRLTMHDIRVPRKKSTQAVLEILEMHVRLSVNCGLQ
jgi:hypothetical protein